MQISDQERCSSNMKPSLRAHWVVSIEIEGLWIFASCRLSPVRRNSVLEELRDKRLKVIQEVMCESILEVWNVCLKVWAMKGEKHLCVISIEVRYIDTQMKWEYREELCTLWRAKDRQQSLEERHTVRCVRKRSNHYILHRGCEMRGRT